MRSRPWTMIHLAAVLVPLVWIFAPLLFHNQFYLSEDLETLLVQYPLHHLLGVSLDGGQLPLWTPLVSGGYPAMAEGEMGAMYPLNLLLFRHFDPFLAYQVLLLLAPLLSLVTGYAYLSYRGHSVPAALLGAMSFALGGFALGHLRFLNQVQAMSMLPLCLLFVERFLDRRRLMDAALAASCWAVAVLAGSYTVAWMTGAGLVIVVLVRCLERPDPSRLIGVSLRWPRRRFHQVLQAMAFVPGAALLTAFLAAPQIMQTWDFLPITTLAGGVSGKDVATTSVGIGALVHFVLPWYHGIPARGTYRLDDLYWETLGYGGILPLALALVSVVRLRHRGHRLAVPWALVCVGMVLALGVHSPLFGWARAVLPGFAWLGVPGRFLLLVQLGLAMLAASGLDLVAQWLAERGERGAWVAGVGSFAIIVGTALDLGYHGSSLLRWMDKEALFQKLPSTAAVPGLGPFRLLSLLDDVSRLQDHRHTVAGTEPLELELRALTWPEYSLLHEMSTASTSLPLAVAHYRLLEKRLLAALPRREDGSLEVTGAALNLLYFLGVRVVSSAVPLESGQIVFLGEVPVPGLSKPIWLYGVPDPYPRAYLARKVKRCGPEVAVRRLEDGRFGMGWDPCGEGEAGEGDEPESSRSVAGFPLLTGRGLTFLDYTVNLLNPGYLVVRETYAPGWISLVDDVEVETMRVDLVYRAVPVPAGRHAVRMEYRPRGLSWGLAANLVGLLFVAFSVFASRSGVTLKRSRIDPSVLEDGAEDEDAWFR